MSFLNPVSETVLQFSSTDANAPQINQSARAAGDIKTLLKACLITGYGTKAGAGWTMQNETDFAAEFVSPSVLLSDYRFGVDDNSSGQTVWYYTYQNNRVNYYGQTIQKSFYQIDNSKSNNWYMLVTKQGFCLIEMIFDNVAQDYTGRLTYFGRIKSGLVEDFGKNMAFFCAGMGAPEGYPHQLFRRENSYRHFVNGNYRDLLFNATNLFVIGEPTLPKNISAVEITNPLYLFANGVFVGEQPALLLKSVNDLSKLYGVKTMTYEGRAVLYVCLGCATGNKSNTDLYAVASMLYLDYWEY